MVTLEHCLLFSHLADEELRALQAVACEREFPQGGDIFKEGDSGDGVYVIKSGQVQITGLVGENVRSVFARIGPGEIFGEMAVLENKPRSACASASPGTAVYFIPRGVMLALVERSPQISFKLLREICARLREFNHHYVREVVQAERVAVVGKFARSIIHDLKNPLNIISLSAEIANLETTPPDKRQTANIYIRKQVERINDMVNEILEFTQGASAAFALQPADYEKFLRQAVEDMKFELEMRGVKIEFDGEPPAVTAAINAKRLRHLLHNLFHNASQAMPKGGKIIIRCKRTAYEVITEIQDTGPGIAPEIVGTLFEPFATFGKKTGTGLGLSICKKIIEDHKGRITAHNAPAGGAVFSFSLPLAKSV